MQVACVCSAERDHIEASADHHVANERASAAGRFNFVEARKDAAAEAHRRHMKHSLDPDEVHQLDEQRRQV